MKIMRALEIGDKVKTKVFRDCNGSERFPIGTIGIITDNDYIEKTPICVYADGECFWYSTDEIELVQELSAAEVLKICNEICHNDRACSNCEMAGNCFFERDSDYQKVVEICEQWKANHEKKEPEFEWVDVCRIIEVQDNGFKKCVHEGDIKDADQPFGNKECTAESILKEYIKTHKGNYFATVEHVCRVKR